MGLLPMELDILPPSDDRVFKLILTAPEAKPVLTDLVSAILGRLVSDVEVRNNELPPADTQEKAERFDINCRLDDGTQIDIEMQASRIQEDADRMFRNLKGKSVYYLCDLHSSQSAKGVRRYDRLAKTYQVTFCSYTVFPHRRDFAHTFSLRSDTDNEQLSDAIHVIYVELSKLQETINKSVSDMTDLEKWAVFFRYAGEAGYRETVNKVIASKEVLQMAGNLLMSISQDERERAVFRSREIYKTDLASNLATVEERGERRGAHNRSLAIAARMLNRGTPIEEIMDVTELSREEIEELRHTGAASGM